MTNLFNVHVLHSLPDDFYADSCNDLVCEDPHTDVGEHLMMIAKEMKFNDEKDYEIAEPYIVEEMGTIVEVCVDMFLDDRCVAKVVAQPVYNS